jgi:predicted ArsR family transcriptional regulator
VLETLQGAAGALTMTDLAAATGLHPNTLREHLEALETAGRVTRRDAAPSGPGRPRALYEALPLEAAGRAEYAGLASALAATIHRTSDDPRRDATEAGVLWGHELATEHGIPAAAGDVAARHQVVDLLGDMGFAPDADGDATSVRLTRCPLLDTARRYPDVVCAVHLGIVRGALDEYGADAAPADLRPFSEPGACRLHLTPPTTSRGSRGTDR